MNAEEVESDLKAHSKVTLKILSPIYINGTAKAPGDVVEFGKSERQNIAKVLSAGPRFYERVDPKAAKKAAKKTSDE